MKLDFPIGVKASPCGASGRYEFRLTYGGKTLDGDFGVFREVTNEADEREMRSVAALAFRDLIFRDVRRELAR